MNFIHLRGKYSDYIPEIRVNVHHDWIGPSDVDSYAYLNYWSVNELRKYNKGYGSTTIALYNMRVDCELHYFVLG